MYSQLKMQVTASAEFIDCALIKNFKNWLEMLRNDPYDLGKYIQSACVINCPHGYGVTLKARQIPHFSDKPTVLTSQTLFTAKGSECIWNDLDQKTFARRFLKFRLKINQREPDFNKPENQIRVGLCSTSPSICVLVTESHIKSKLGRELMEDLFRTLLQSVAFNCITAVQQ